MLSPLDLKLFRDIGKMKGQMSSGSGVMAYGRAMMIMARSLIFSLESTSNIECGALTKGDLLTDLALAIA